MTAKRVYFFSGAEYVRFDHPLDGVLPLVYPRGIAGAWPGLTSPIDAAVNWGNGKAYLFKGAEYIRHDIASGNIDPGYPKPIAGNWGGVAGTTRSGGPALLRRPPGTGCRRNAVCGGRRGSPGSAARGRRP